MNQRHIAFPSIGQFRDAIKHVRKSSEWHNIAVPTLKLSGTVKIHGTNFGICRPVNGGVDAIWTQSRERLTTPESDNAGSSIFAYARKEWIDRFFNGVLNRVSVDVTIPDLTIQVYGEFCCGNIQKGVGVTQIKDKKFVIFDVRISVDAESLDWVPMKTVLDAFNAAGPVEDVYCINQFQQYELICDFSNPEEAQNRMVEITDAVEADCPVARHFLGADYDGPTVGEGVVWRIADDQPTPFDLRGLRLKVKGEKHQNSKVKTTASIDVEKVNSINEFVEYALTTNRMEQMLQKMVELGVALDTTNTGSFLRLCLSDVFKEEMDTLAASGLTTKEVNGKLATTARNFYLEHLE